MERLRIRNGVVSMFIKNKETTTEETIPMSDFRIRSRKANLADCTCFLRPGIDVCVLSVYQPPDEESNDDEEDPEPVSFFVVRLVLVAPYIFLMLIYTY